jgi:hypothetical protein
MDRDFLSSLRFSSLLVHLRQDAAGHYTAQAVGLPALAATAATRDEALDQLQSAVAEWVSSGQLVTLTIQTRAPARKPAGWAAGDPLEQEFLEDLARQRQQDLDRTLREDEQEDQGCSGTPRAPTT